MILNTAALAVALVTTTGLMSQAKAERVCRQECSGSICKEECVETSDRDRERITIEGRGERREERREEKREPGVELKLPGVGVEIGR
jgi:hypothetical protein